MVKRSTRVIIAALILSTVGLIGTGVAQGISHKELYFTVSVPYRLRMGNYLLPAGYYTLKQVSANDLNLFFLYQGDKRHSPIAAVRTVRVDNTVRGYSDDTDMTWKIDEESGTRVVPVISGWEIPGEDGWEIISVVPRGDGRRMLAKARY
jgi:hypothetical protein